MILCGGFSAEKRVEKIRQDGVAEFISGSSSNSLLTLLKHLNFAHPNSLLNIILLQIEITQSSATYPFHPFYSTLAH